ncbi:MAG: TonB-dependent hemoglobin/transferrin/lactoferrin family receptor [Pseudomonadota bacterium]
MITRTQRYALALLTASLSAGSAAQNDDVVRLEETEISGSQTSLITDGLDLQVLQEQMTYNIEDSVRYIPGVQINDVGNRFGDDGFNIRGLEGDFVAITIDGVDQGETLNPPGFAAYGMFGSSRGAVEVETVKAIQVTRGANSVTNGNGALAGAVTYETKSPSDFLGIDDDTYLGFRTGFDTRTDEMLYSGSFANRTGRWESLVILTARDGHETEAHDDGANVSGPDRGQSDPVDRTENSILAKLNYSLTDQQTLGFVVELNDRDADVLPLSRQSASYYDFVAEDKSDRQRFGVSYAFDDIAAPWVDTITTTLDYQELETSGVTTFAFSQFNADPTDDYLRTENRAFNQEMLRFALDFENAFETGAVSHQLVYGFEYQDRTLSNELFDIRRETLDPTSALRSFTVDPTWIPETDVNRLSFYVRDELTLTSQLSVFGGLRYDNTEYSPSITESFEDPTGDAVNDADYGAFVGELGVRFAITDNHAIGLSVGQGFKAPTTQDLYYGVSADFITDINTNEQFSDYDELSNPSLEPERSTNYELMYEYATDRARLRVTGFMSEYDELIQTVSNTRSYGQDVTYEVFSRFTGLQQFTTSVDEFAQADNVGSVDVMGFEVDALVSLTDALALNFGYSHVRGEHNEDDADGFSHEAGDDLATAAPDSAVLGLSYNAPSGDWGLSSYLVWTDARDETDDQSIASLNNGGGPILFPDSWQTVDVFGYYNLEAFGLKNARVSLAVRNLFDENYIRWEVINSVRPGNGGFFGGATESGAARFSDPGRSFAVNLTLDF